MSEQIFVGSKPKPSKIEPIEQLEDRSKPDTGGFWTSPYDPDYISEFIRYEQGNLVPATEDVWKLQMDTESANILYLDSVERLEQQPTVSPQMGRHTYLDFETLFETYDAIYVDADLAHRKGLSTKYSLRGWDVTTYLWKDLSYVQKIEHLGVVKDLVSFVD